MSANTSAPSAKQSYVMPIVVMFFLFAMISFVTGFMNPFGVILKEQLSLSSLSSQLGGFALFLAYAFFGIPAGKILQNKGYKHSAMTAVIVGIVGVAIMFISSIMPESATFPIYLLGAFVSGISMCMLNTVVNPMLNTLGGGGKKGNMLLQFGGACNSLAATICPIFVGFLMGESLSGLSLSDAQPALLVAAGIFVIALVVLGCSKLPEPELKKIHHEDKADRPKVSGALKFRHLVLGIVSIFLYVGIENGIPNMANLYMTTPTMEKANETVAEWEKQNVGPDAENYLAMCRAADEANKDTKGYTPTVVTQDSFARAESIVAGNSPVGLNIPAAVAGSFVGLYWLLMLVGRLSGGALGSFLSSRKMLISVCSLGLLFLLLAVFMPVSYVSVPFVSDPIPLNILFLVLCGLCTSVMWGSIFNLAVEGLGKYTAIASGLFMTMVCGGGILPLIQGAVADAFGYMSSYWVLIIALSFILYYALIGCKPTRKAEK